MPNSRHLASSKLVWYDEMLLDMYVRAWHVLGFLIGRKKRLVFVTNLSALSLSF